MDFRKCSMNMMSMDGLKDDNVGFRRSPMMGMLRKQTTVTDTIDGTFFQLRILIRQVIFDE